MADEQQSAVYDAGGDDGGDDAQSNMMMYASRMTYLAEQDPIKPDTMFLTRKQAQKLVHRQSDAKVFKKIEVAAKKAPEPKNWKKHAALRLEDTRQTWEKRFQAGVHFWQSLETGECRVNPPCVVAADAKAKANQRHERCLEADEDEANEDEDEDDKDISFPPGFEFLEVHDKTKPQSS